jgi:predicted lysophospholipase L1 biosynthesis ABC-type transport system permease subunit
MDSEARIRAMATAAMRALLTLCALVATLGVRDGDMSWWLVVLADVLFALALLASVVLIAVQEIRSDG